MDSNIQLAQRILSHFPYAPNDQQLQLTAALARYCTPAAGNTPSADRVFLLNGYAGTGKTSIIGALVKALADVRVPTVLLAPTGRAAKVLAGACSHPAYTIHRRIYRGDAAAVAGYAPIVNDNRLTGAVFIVDEASMIGSESAEGVNLLHDLIHYVFSGTDCRLILIGDSAQLPPVGCELSPAMDPEVLRSMGLKTTRATITATARQRGGSGILYNATRLRVALQRRDSEEEKDEDSLPVIYASPFDDVRVIGGGDELAEAILADYNDAPDDDGMAETIIITRSNRRATEFNRGVRSIILGHEEELCRGDRLMVVKNNYLWGAKIKRFDFIANGDVAIVERIISTEERYTLRWADVELYFPDRDTSLECKIMVDTLSSLSASLDADKAARFEQAILNDPDLFTPSITLEQRRRALKNDLYYNALRVKYAYCVTCHKAQGGQWRNVYVDIGYLPPETSVNELLRWLYTATTRATTRLNFIAPPLEVK